METALSDGNREHVYYDMTLAHKYRFQCYSLLSIVSRFVSFIYLGSVARVRSCEIPLTGRLLPSTRFAIDFGSNILALILNQQTLFSLVCANYYCYHRLCYPIRSESILALVFGANKNVSFKSFIQFHGRASAMAE